MSKRQVTTSREHIQSLTKATPLQAIEELIWNGLDAGGPMVEVRLGWSPLSGSGTIAALQSIDVVDSGIGIPIDDLDRAFGEIGHSKKPQQKVNGEGRLLHGSEGKGRLRALAVSRQPAWTTTYRKDGKLRRYSVRINRDEPDFFDVSPEEIVASGSTGTVVHLDNVDEQCDSLSKDGARESLTRRFALYLSEYPGASITFAGQLLKVEDWIDAKKNYPLILKGRPPAVVTIIEWRFKLDSRRLYLCSESGSSFHDLPLRLPAPGLEFTAYLRSPEIKGWAEAGLLAADEMDESVQQLLEGAREQIRSHIRERLSIAAQDVVDEWKQQEVYPYKEAEARTPLVIAEQQVFNIVAVQINALHPTFKSSDLDNKRLTLNLMRRAVESNPSALASLLKTFVALPEEEQQELAHLLQRTSLSALIKAGTIVTERLDTVQAFLEILYAEDWKPRLLERTQLHRLLVHELWLLGDEYQIATDDDGLREVLRKHCEILERDELAPEVDVKLINGKGGIPDLMLWHRGRADRSLFEHLVVELKRPKDPLGQKEIGQIENYAFTVADDERFKTEKVRWRFVLLGNGLDTYAEQRTSNDTLPAGCIHRKGNVSIWVQRWSDVLADAQVRYEFFRERLDVQASKDEGLKRLKTRYEHLFTGRGARKQKDLEIMAQKAPQ